MTCKGTGGGAVHLLWSQGVRRPITTTMPRNDSSPSRSAPDERAHERPEQRANGAGVKRGRSGYGMESIRPHLRAQLEQQKLLRPTFPPEDPEEDERSNRADR